jgi:transcriptional regulator with XRE-family HTH domain
MSEKLGVHINTYLNWEKDPGKISIDHAKKISEVLGVPLDEIIFKAEPGET